MGYDFAREAVAADAKTERGGSFRQLGAFFSFQAAEACPSRLKSEGFTNLHINMIPIHPQLDDWEFDR